MNAATAKPRNVAHDDRGLTFFAARYNEIIKTGIHGLLIFIVLFFPWWDSTFLGAAADQEYNVPIALIVVQAQTYSLTNAYHLLSYFRNFEG